MRVFKKKVMLRNQPWKNKKRRRRRERSRDDIDRSQPHHIPLDLTLEILSRLPAKSIMRYQCVSKQWSSFTKLPSFINSFTSRSSERPPRLLITFEAHYKQLVVSFPQNQNPDGSYSPVYSYQISNSDWTTYPHSESVHGLILTDQFRIRNPTLGQFFALPYCPFIWGSRGTWGSYLGYDPLEGKHKVLYTSTGKYIDQPGVLTLGGQESWRIITKGRCPMHSSYGAFGRCFNGILYYRARLLDCGYDIIMSFDVKSEYFNPIEFPEDRCRSLFHMIPYEGRPALVIYDHPFDHVELHILRDAHGHVWKRERFDLHLPYKIVGRDLMIRFVGATDAGEFVFAPIYGHYEAFYIIYFDPRRSNTRKVVFEKEMDEFRRRCGLDSNNKFTMHRVFPNHIESLFSL